MRALRCFALLLSLVAPMAFADGLYQVELIIFRQAGEPIPASQTAPDDWAAGVQGSAADNARGTALNGEAAKLNEKNGYTVLLHQAWQQSMGEAPTRIAVNTGNQQFGHYPVEGTLSLKQVKFVDLDANFWINQFDGTGLLTGSERLKQSARLKTGELTYLDHSNLGMLIRISPL
jgi:hypothetical protein